MSDDGRTTGKLMRAYNKYLHSHLPPPWDLRRPLYVLSDTPHIWDLQEEMEYVYKDEKRLQDLSLSKCLMEFRSIDIDKKNKLLETLGEQATKALPIPDPRSGYKRGNLLMAILFYICKEDLSKTMHIMQDLLDVSDDILPITQDKALIQAITDHSELVISQDSISNNPDSYTGRIIKMELTSDSLHAKINPEVIEKTKSSSYVILTPGDIHTSIGSNFLPQWAKTWIENHTGKIMCIMNPINKDGEARGLSILEYIMILEGYIGRKFDYIIANKTPQDWSQIADDISVKNGEPFVMESSLVSLLEARWSTVILADLLDTNHITYRYDTKKMAAVLESILV